MVIKILADCGIIGDDTAQLSKVLHCIEDGAIDADMRRTVCFSWRGLVQHLSLLQVNGQARVLCCIREAVDDVL